MHVKILQSGSEVQLSGGLGGVDKLVDARFGD
jgi:hypothetical protein